MSTPNPPGSSSLLKSTGLGLVAGFVIPVLVIAALVQFSVRSQNSAHRSGPTMSEQAIAQRLKPVGQLAAEGAPAPAQPAEAAPAEAATPEERIKPVGDVAVAPPAPGAKAEASPAAPKPEAKPAAPEAPPAPAGAAAGLKSGPEVYKSVCGACHETGAAGAPKFGDAAAWGPRLKQGLDKLTENAIKGKGAMPPKGGAVQLSDTEIALAVIHMADNAGGAAAPAAAKAPEKTAAAPAPAPAAPAGDKGKKTYEQTCAACHATGATGAANAPKFGDKAAWGPRIAAGKPALYASALKGKGAMPPKGGNAGLADDDVKAAVDYMVSQAK
jgi:cytochrome c5